MKEDKTFKRAESFKDYLESMKTYQYVTYYLTLEDCQDPFVREVAGRHCYMLDFLLKYHDMPFVCPDNQTNVLSGLTITESEWLWQVKSPEGRHYYYQEDEHLHLTKFKRFNQGEIEIGRPAEILRKFERYITHAGAFVKKDGGVIFFEDEKGMCIPVWEIDYYYYTDTDKEKELN